MDGENSDKVTGEIKRENIKPETKTILIPERRNKCESKPPERYGREHIQEIFGDEIKTK